MSFDNSNVSFISISFSSDVNFLSSFLNVFNSFLSYVSFSMFSLGFSMNSNILSFLVVRISFGLGVICFSFSDVDCRFFKISFNFN